jgi:hypothetical protein
MTPRAISIGVRVVPVAIGWAIPGGRQMDCRSAGG